MADLRSLSAVRPSLDVEDHQRMIGPTSPPPPLTLADAVPSRRQRWLAVGVASFLLAYSAAVLPVAQRAGPMWPSFIGIYQTAVILSDLLTAMFLLFQFQQFRQPGMLVLGGGYLFTSAIATVHLLSFPGLFGEHGVIGGPQTTNWLWIFWHGGFPLFVLAYLAVDASGTTFRRGAGRTVWLSALGVVALAALLGLLATSEAVLPALIVGNNYNRINETGLGPVLVVLCLAALLLTLRQRGSTVIKLWLTVTMLAFALDVFQNLHSGARFTFGWYAARGNSFVASVLALAVYVVENNLLLRHWVTSSRELAAANDRLVETNARLAEALADQQRLARETADANDRLAAALQEQKRLAGEAEQANRSKSRFLAAASHDIRQPVQSLMLFVSVLRGRLENRPEAGLLATVDQALQTLKRLLDGILDLSKLEAGVVTASVRSIPVAEILDGLAAEYMPRAGERGLRLGVVRCSARVRSDPLLLSRMVRNLVENALRYTESGRILVGCRRRGRRLRVEVHDTGVGIPEDRVAEVFEEFVQIGNQERDGDKGLGLGLAIVRRLAQLLHHPLDVRSRPGHGSTFAVDVPIAVAEAETVEAPLIQASARPREEAPRA
jgi:signal transduction histidine kinase